MRAASATARGRLAGMMQRLREQRHVDAAVLSGSVSISPRFHVMFDTPRRSASASPASARPPSDRCRSTRLAHRADSTDRYPSPQAMSATSTGGKQRAKRAGPACPAAARHELRAVGAVNVEVLFAQPYRPRAAARRPRTACGCAASANCACSAGQRPPNPPSSRAGERR